MLPRLAAPLTDEQKLELAVERNLLNEWPKEKRKTYRANQELVRMNVLIISESGLLWFRIKFSSILYVFSLFAVEIKSLETWLTNQSKDAFFFNQSGAEPKPPVAWCTPVFPRFSLVACYFFFFIGSLGLL